MRCETWCCPMRDQRYFLEWCSPWLNAHAVCGKKRALRKERPTTPKCMQISHMLDHENLELPKNPCIHSQNEFVNHHTCRHSHKPMWCASTNEITLSKLSCSVIQQVMRAGHHWISKCAPTHMYWNQRWESNKKTWKHKMRKSNLRKGAKHTHFRIRQIQRK